MSDQIVVRRASAEHGDARALAEVLVDCVDGGASVGFMLPFDVERAEAFWDTTLDGASRGERVVLVAEDEAAIAPLPALCTVAAAMFAPRKMPA